MTTEPRSTHRSAAPSAAPAAAQPTAPAAAPAVLAPPVTRRGFLARAATVAVALGWLPRSAQGAGSMGTGAVGAGAAAGRARGAGRRSVGRPLCISSGNGLRAVEAALAASTADGAAPMHAVVAGVKVVEDDPNDMSVGYGGLPNERGVVELDAAVMEGRLHRAGAVGGLQGYRNPAAVALKVLERTDHVMLVGAGAAQFAAAHGFREEDLLTDAARARWLRWKEQLSDDDDWLSHTGDPAEGERPGGTIHCALLDPAGHIACTTTTSGLAFKIPGRVGDSPIIGAGLYCTDEVGSCGATGRGEAVILEAGSFAVVETMRAGATPTEACLEVLARIARHAPARHRNAAGGPDFDVKFYAMSVDGEYGSAGIRPGGRFAVGDPDGGARLEDMHAL